MGAGRPGLETGVRVEAPAERLLGKSEQNRQGVKFAEKEDRSF